MNTTIYNELYLRIIDQMPNPIWRAGVNAKCDFFNKAWLDFTGRTIDQEMGDGWAEGVYKDDFDTCLKTYLDAFAKKIPFEMEYRLRYKDHTYHWILDCGSPFFDNNNIFLGYIGSCYDINISKQHVEEIEKMNKVMIDRELKMVELKRQMELLQKKLNNAG